MTRRSSSTRILPEALFGRGVAKLMKGDIFASTADLAAAREKKPSIAEEFAKAGVRAQQKQQY